MASSIYNFYITPDIVCELDGSCDGSLSAVIRGLFIRVVASTCLTSRLIIILKGKSQTVQYSANIEKFHVITPMTCSEIKVLNRVAYQTVMCVFLLTIPINILRLIMLWDKSNYTLMCFVLMYIQNTSMHFIETHFTVLCYNLYHKFVEINKDLTTLKINTILRNKYPFLLRTGNKYGKNNSFGDYNGDVINSLAAGHTMTNYVEQLKIKHRIVREALKNLNDLFGAHLGLSLCSLCLYAMFDIYYYMLGAMKPTNSFVIVYGWLLQYTVRFGSITILTHLTTKQVIF